MLKNINLFKDPSFRKYRKDINEQNYITLKNTSFGGIIISLGLVLIAVIGKEWGANFIIYSLWLLVSFTTFILCSYKEKFVKKNAAKYVYIFTMIMYTIATVSGTYYFKENNATVVIGYLAIMPFIIFDQIGRFCTYEVFLCTMFCVASISIKAPSIALLDCLNAIGFTTLSCVIGFKTIQLKLSSIKAKYAIIKQRDTDHLTGLYSRNATEKYINDWLKNGNGEAVFLIIDLDNFKRINDTMGHLTGDRALVWSANVIKKVFKNNECLSRWGGDEFLIFLLNDIEYAQKKAEELIKTISMPIIEGKRSYSISASVGMTLCHPGDDFDEIYRRADNALYKSKDKGRNCYSITEGDRY